MCPAPRSDGYRPPARLQRPDEVRACSHGGLPRARSLLSLSGRVGGAVRTGVAADPRAPSATWRWPFDRVFMGRMDPAKPAISRHLRLTGECSGFRILPFVRLSTGWFGTCKNGREAVVIIWRVLKDSILGDTGSGGSHRGVVSRKPSRTGFMALDAPLSGTERAGAQRSSP